jgi:hypothetical protein
MLSIKSIVLSIVAAASLVGSIGHEAIAQTTGNVVIVAGKTNNGSRLLYDPDSIRIDRSGEALDKSRVFNYAVMKPSGEISVNIGAHTHWCRFGKVQVDARAVDKQTWFFTKQHLGIDTMKQPGWFSDKGYIVANSPASRNLLKAICATDTSNNF